MNPHHHHHHSNPVLTPFSDNKPEHNHHPKFFSAHHYVPVTPNSLLQPKKADQVRFRAGATLHVCNLPEHINNIGLRKIFSPHGTVLDAFAPFRPNSMGKRFGFVRLRNSDIAAATISALDGSQFHGQRLCVKFAKDPFRVLKTTASNVDELQQNPTASTGGFSTGTANTKAVVGGLSQLICNIFRWSIIAVANTDISQKSISEQLLAEGISDLSVHYLGSRVFLLSFIDEAALKAREMDNWSTLSKWFFHFHSSIQLPHSGGRFAWLSVRGVPPILWSYKTLSQLCGSDDSMILAHPSSLDGSHLEQAHILVFTSKHAPISHQTPVTFDGSNITAFVSELPSSKIPLVTSRSSEKLAPFSSSDFPPPGFPFRNSVFGSTHEPELVEADRNSVSSPCQQSTSTKALEKNTVLADSHSIGTAPSLFLHPKPLQPTFSKDNPTSSKDNPTSSKANPTSFKKIKSHKATTTSSLSGNFFHTIQFKKSLHGPYSTKNLSHLKSKAKNKSLQNVRATSSQPAPASTVHFSEVPENLRHTLNICKSLGLTFRGDEGPFLKELSEMEHRVTSVAT